MDAIEDDAICRIFRWVSTNIQQQVDNFKPQELSNTVWAYATIGFGYDESSGLNIHNDYTYVATDAPGEDKLLVYDTLEIIAENGKFQFFYALFYHSICFNSLLHVLFAAKTAALHRLETFKVRIHN
jgi:hypothetical protein